MKSVDELAEELFGTPTERGEFRQFSQRDKAKSWYDPSEYGDSMTVSQLEAVIANENIVYSDDHGNGTFDNLADILRSVEDRFDSVEIRVGGALHEGHTWIDTMWIHYGEPLPPSQHDAFEEFAVLKFKSTMREATAGVDPETDDRVELSHECFRQPRDDPSLWIKTTEFEFRQDEEWGKYLRLWWD